MRCLLARRCRRPILILHTVSASACRQRRSVQKRPKDKHAVPPSPVPLSPSVQGEGAPPHLALRSLCRRAQRRQLLLRVPQLLRSREHTGRRSHD